MHTARFRRLGGIAAAMAIITTTAACGSSSTSDTPSGSSSGSSTSSASASQDSNAGKLNGTKVGMVGLYNLPYITHTADGAKAASAEYGAEFTQYGPQGLDPNKAIADFQNAVAAGNKGMLVFAYPSELWVKPIDRAVDQGVVVVTTDDYSEGSKAITEGGAGKVAMGAAVADEFIKKIPEGTKGTIVPGICVPGLPVLIAPLEGFKIRMKEQRPDVTVIEPEATSGDPAQDFAAWQRIIAKYPDALGFLGLCDVDLANMAKLASSNPDAKWLYGNTVGGDDASILTGLEGNFVGAVSQRAWVQGYVGMKLILDNLANGAALPDGWVNTGYDVVTNENLETIKKTLTDPAAAEEYYGAMAQRIFENAAKDAIKPFTYQYDVASVNEPNPQP